MKRGVYPTATTAKISLFDFSKGMRGDVDGKIAGASIPEKTFNFCFSDGALKDGTGISNLSLPYSDGDAYPVLPSGLKPKKCYYYKRFDYTSSVEDDRLLVLCNDGYVYSYAIGMNGQFEKVEALYFTKTPGAVCYKYNGDDVMIFSSGTCFKIYDGENVTVVDGVPEVTSMCMHSERLFVTTGGEQTSLWFSDDFDPANFYLSLDQAGFIDFQDSRGRLLKVISFNNCVYVFRNYGITRLSAYGDQSEFYATGLFLGSGRIFKNAIVDCGNRIVYLAEDGFYSFDGYYAVRILKSYDKYLLGVDNSQACGKFFNGKLYIAMRMKINGSELDVLFVYDTASESSYVMDGLGVKDMEIIAANGFSRLAMLSENSNYIGMLYKKAECFQTPLNKVWASNFSDFGIDREKTLVKISLFTNVNVQITVRSDRGEKTLSVSGDARRQAVPVRLRGNTFSVELKSSAPKAEISKVALYFNYFKV